MQIEPVKVRRETMSEFTIVDLYSQRKVVIGHVKGWDISAILEWLGRFGTITTPRENGIYVFESPTGIKTAFYFTVNNELDFINPGWL